MARYTPEFMLEPAQPLSQEEASAVNNQCHGKITIGEYTESFYMSDQMWDIVDYQDQWEEAWAYLQEHGKTVFIVNIQGRNRLVVSWVVYKKGSHLHFQNHLFVGDTAFRFFENPLFNPDNSIVYIPEYQTHTKNNMPISEWIIPAPMQERVNRSKKGVLAKLRDWFTAR